MNYLKIQILCLMASLCLAQASVHAIEADSNTLVLRSQMQATPGPSEKIGVSDPRRACYNQVYKAAKAAQSSQNSLTGHNYTDMYDTILGRCLEARSNNLLFTKSDPNALADCLNEAVTIATEKNDATTRKFLVQQVVHKKLDKGGPTVAFTLYSPAHALWGAFQWGAAGAVAGSALGLTASLAHNRALDSIGSTTHTIEGNGFNLNPATWFTRSIVTTTKPSDAHQKNKADILKTMQNSGIAGGILGALAGIPCGIKISVDL